ncbi:unnamed protein product [Trichogramma brassicae]|uniref:Uncharacterized protein n=1 Tax=Trichogramma brassicae TaxID=86971 RepID=A0A6H5IDV6_9HYME|nr:unnamed protein product [Trichogramma brassicae]
MGFVGTRVMLEFHDYSASFEGFERISDVAPTQQKKSANITVYATRYIARDQLVCAQSRRARETSKTKANKYARANELLLILKLVFASSDRILFARALLASSNETAVPAHAEALYNDEILKILYAGGARVSCCVSTTHNGVQGHNDHAAQRSPTCIHTPRADVIAAVRATMTALGQFCMQFYDIRTNALEEKAENNEKRIGRARSRRAVTGQCLALAYAELYSSRRARMSANFRGQKLALRSSDMYYAHDTCTHTHALGTFINAWATQLPRVEWLDWIIRQSAARGLNCCIVHGLACRERVISCEAHAAQRAMQPRDCTRTVNAEKYLYHRIYAQQLDPNFLSRIYIPRGEKY